MLDPASVERGRPRARGIRLSRGAGGDLPRLHRACARTAAEATRTWSPRWRSPAIRRDPDSWGGRPVLLYGFDDLTGSSSSWSPPSATAAEVTVALTYEDRPGAGRPRHAPARAPELGEGDVEHRGDAPRPTRPTPRARCSSRSSAASPSTARRTQTSDGSLVLLRSAGERGEAEAIGGGDRRGCSPRAPTRSAIAVALRDPAGRGRLLAARPRVLRHPGRARGETCRSPARRRAAPCSRCCAAAFAGRHGGRRPRLPAGPAARRPRSNVDWLERPDPARPATAAPRRRRRSGRSSQAAS